MVIVALLAVTGAALVILHPWRPTASAPASTSQPAPSDTDIPAPGPTDSPTDLPPATDDPSVPPTSSAAQDQAAAIDAMLTTSASARGGVQPAIDAIWTCTSTAADVAALRQAADVRTQLVDQLDQQPVDALPGGSEMADDLRAAWTRSAAADELYLRWRDAAVRRCPKDHYANSSKTRGDATSKRATEAKDDFLELWNHVAPGFGLATRTSNQI